MIGVRRKKRGEREGGGRRSCFEHYLSSLPRLDPVDRTVSWVYQHPDDSEVRVVRGEGGCHSAPLAMPIPMVSFFLPKVSFWPKTMDYNKAF